jgi:hypothetical protein
MLKFVKFLALALSQGVQGKLPKNKVKKPEYDMVFVTDKKGRKLKFRKT